MTTDNENPAFPVGTFYLGMTLRDYFAAKAMQAQLSMPEVFLSLSEKNVTADEICDSCFEWADAMLEARSK